MSRLFRRFADPIVRRQLVRALEARDNARAAVRVLRHQLTASRAEVEALAGELAEARYGSQQGEKQ